MGQFVPLESASSISRKLAAASVAQVNSFTDQATLLGTVVTLVTADGATFQSSTSNATDLSVRCSSNSLPINYRSIWTDFGGGNQTDSHGWNYNSEGELPTKWGMAVVLETPYSGLMEYWWTLQAPTASAFTTWRSMFSFVTQATSVAELQWRYDKMQWFANPNRNAEVNPLFEINTYLEIVTSNAALGVGADPRADANGAMFKVAGSAGTSLEHVVIAPTALTTTATIVSVQVPNVADATGYQASGAVSGTLNEIMRNTHATGAARATIWTVGGDAANRWLTTNCDFTSGADNSDSLWALVQGDALDTGRMMTIAKTTFIATHYGRVQFSGATHSGLRLNSLTTAQRDALTPANGDLIYNSTTDKAQIRAGGAWVDLH